MTACSCKNMKKCDINLKQIAGTKCLDAPHCVITLPDRNPSKVPNVYLLSITLSAQANTSTNISHVPRDVLITVLAMFRGSTSWTLTQHKSQVCRNLQIFLKIPILIPLISHSRD